MSNHWHAVLWDRDGEIAEFARTLHRQTARCIGAHLGRDQQVWEAKPYSAIPLHTPEDTLAKIAYTLGNPCRHHAVDQIRSWPGVSIGPVEGLAKVYCATRPLKYFSKKSRTVPALRSLQLIKPPTLAHLSDQEYCTQVAELCRETELEWQHYRKTRGLRVQGRKAVLSAKPGVIPRSEDSPNLLNPKLIARDKELKAQLLEEHRAWVSWY
ncbi:MAG: hypothetical protein KC561_21560, partial [Myxococcales bacterium]|nr:hypothetical protein [Myxococcales bacterium]